jgi:hypothetical protein
MSRDLADIYELPKGWWFWPEAEESDLLYAELQRELPPGHLIYRVPVLTFATARGVDDVLFRHRDKFDRFTVIHLTWAGKTEINSLHPAVEFDGSFLEFLEEEKRKVKFFKEIAQKNRSKKSAN